MKLFWFPQHIGDYLTLTQSWTPEHKGMLVNLYCAACQEDPPGTLPDDNARLKMAAQATPQQWRYAREIVLSGWTTKDGRLICGWLYKHCLKAQQTSEKRSQATRNRKDRRSKAPSIDPSIDTSKDPSNDRQSLKPVSEKTGFRIASVVPLPLARHPQESDRTESEPVSQSSLVQKTEADSEQKDPSPTPSRFSPGPPGPFGGRSTADLWNIMRLDYTNKTDIFSAKDLFYSMKVNGSTLQDMLRVVKLEQEDGCSVSSLGTFLAREQWQK